MKFLIIHSVATSVSEWTNSHSLALAATRFATAPALLFAAIALPAAELTPGDAEFRKALGRDCPVVYLWPEGKAPDEVRPIGDEFTQPSKNVPDITMIQNVTRPSIAIIAPPSRATR